jgi:hypothetical protein
MKVLTSVRPECPRSGRIEGLHAKHVLKPEDLYFCYSLSKQLVLFAIFKPAGLYIIKRVCDIAPPRHNGGNPNSRFPENITTQVYWDQNAKKKYIQFNYFNFNYPAFTNKPFTLPL